MLIDILFIALMALSVFKGFQKGLIVAIFSVLAFIIGLAAALKLSTVVASFLNTNLSVHTKWLPFISFTLVFLGVIFLVKMGARLVERTAKFAMLGWLNKLGGIVLYAILYLIILSIFIFYAEKLQLIKPLTIQSSLTYNFIKPWGPLAIDNFGKVLPFFKDMFSELGSYFESISKK